MTEPRTDTQAALIQAARDTFIETGASRATMAGIARRAGVSRQTAYNHFASVDKLAAEVMTAEVIALLGEEGPEEFAGDADDFIDRVIDVTSRARDNELFVALIRKDPEVFVTYQFERLGSSQKIIIYFITSMLDKVAESGSSPGLAERNRHDMAAMILMITQAAALSREAVVPELSSDTAWKTELTTMLKGYLSA
ncbi:TetR/AcrR family transcriptional regulator [Corynebacterium lubricantis]|uniref:TetR/AcrR family transcriptional regulator n=1 Tax=Corynebacterium lubricantis TaxID=541095 RepID=UPI00036629E1|nr:TetR/AcrR family transcriptional regulator [Corynebacterium lubricantis]